MIPRYQPALIDFCIPFPIQCPIDYKNQLAFSSTSLQSWSSFLIIHQSHAWRDNCPMGCFPKLAASVGSSHSTRMGPNGIHYSGIHTDNDCHWTTTMGQ